ncbi:ribosome small subunit-dependent GTPase A [Fodinibius halophilus]|uniref:Small ribosomal subunit biogenesis GTPase RsgA n=1 Tax=Fodinibius halophilus TaxID=1736908 RepID=A0A6M1T156_9BACT|nr:ribosome small subunit-dependent GTPase A [Fodinibius halophilus]NGP86915.1 ribosome small subunit-dependent GTPase A [Fodinibius halophilus]
MEYRGRVVESTGRWYEVSYKKDDETTHINCRLPGRFRLEDHALTNPIAVGDYVHFTINDDGSGSIEKIEDRENYLIRESTHHQKGNQILAANIDAAYVVVAVKLPKLKPQFLDRFLVTCEAYQIPARIVINKMDLADEEDKRSISYLTELYESLGYEVLTTSIEWEDTLENLKESLKGITSVFVGPSGVGKTSLLNRINPGIDRKVGNVSTYNEKGKHTTTFAKILPLVNEGYLVDTPGIREFGLVNIDPWELSLFFPEMLEPRQRCKFNNCTHSHEPGCGVIGAFEEGHIDPGRYDSYLNILDSLKDD